MIEIFENSFAYDTSKVNTNNTGSKTWNNNCFVVL